MEFHYDRVYAQPATQRIYNQESYLTTLEATLLYLENDLAVFDRTIFYAESGGQVCDVGSIRAVVGGAPCPVVDVQHKLGHRLYIKREGVNVPLVDVETRIVHRLAYAPNLQPGDRVIMQINWSRRYAIMRHHTLAHFLFSAFSRHFSASASVKGCIIDAQKAVFSLDKKLSDDDFSAIQSYTREMLAQGSPMWIEPAPETDTLFYWNYGETIIPCGGTHVQALAEISDAAIFFHKKNTGRKRCRISIALQPLV
ncbi:serine-tRNA(Ala) deacylase AlaX [Edwardsiella ictaluri]|nr:serine-tRNA(Ala) deacylase AlaX [Edwardsiella ictaluri]EKS7763700.1 serine-tRNA(Ala) deacylase AlaX [Edwardsiella ictaluri]EKS7770544.1 serine-tRNA(Ala) deacylase AlaX [Edwardsiella ictaluri]EKS7773686.1 serine-tRNA(Ala) deacylase AlaX [Edwardsiella ictaluri]EKS7776993.1 serine-tRNA(Ala) deacylase AlaX [Edwardsiella ictaluri]